MVVSSPVPPIGLSAAPRNLSRGFVVGDAVHFAVPDARCESGRGKHGSIVLFVDGTRALLASSPDVPNVKVENIGAERMGLSWVRTSSLGRGHENCQTATRMNVDKAWELRGKLLLGSDNASGLREAAMLSGQLPLSPSSDDYSFKEYSSDTQDALPAEPLPIGDQSKWRDDNTARDLRALIAEAFKSEQRSMESWVGSFQQQLQKVTGEIFTSFRGKIEADIDKRLALYGDTLRSPGLNMGSQAAATSQEEGNRANSIPLTAPVQTLPELHATSRSDSFWDKEMEEEVQGFNGDPENGACRTVSVGAASTNTAAAAARMQKMEYHMAMMQKLDDSNKRHQEFRQCIDNCCGVYHKKCVPKELGNCIQSSLFNNICAAVTIVFAVAVGLESDLNIRAVVDDRDNPEWIGIFVDAFNVWFACEVVLRISAGGTDYFIGEDWRWNFFDVFLVSLSIMDMVASTGALGFMRVLRALKVVKALRVVRLLRLFHELRLLIASMVSSLSSLFWSLIFLVVVCYLFAVAFIQAGAHYLKEKSKTDDVASGVVEYYPHLMEAMYTLALCITGGVDWGDAAEPLWGFGWIYGCMMLVFVFFCLFGILNVITSIFVDRAANMKRHDRDFAIAEELRVMEHEIKETMDLFTEMDKDNQGSIHMDVLDKFLRKTRVIAHFSALGIDVTDRAYISQTLQEDESGMISIKAFVMGCISLRGSAKQSDTLSIIYEVKKLAAEVDEFRREFQSKVRRTSQYGAPRDGGRNSVRSASGVGAIKRSPSQESGGLTTC